MIKETLTSKLSQRKLKRIINEKFRPDERLEIWYQLQTLKKRDGDI